MDTIRFGFGDILSEAKALIGAHAGFLFAVMAAVAAGYVVIDLTISESASSLPSLIVGIFVQYLVLERLLANRIPPAEVGNRHFGAIFLASLLGGLGMLLGFVLLIVPGLVLAAGWVAAGAFVVVEGKGGAAALGASWRATAGSRLPIIAILIVTYLPPVLLAVLAGFMAMDDPEAVEGPVAVVVADALVSVLSTWGWVLGAAVYNLAMPSDSAIEDIFG